MHHELFVRLSGIIPTELCFRFVSPPLLLAVPLAM